MLDKLTCPSSASLQQALEIINANAKRLVFVVDDGGKLIGLLTDGDIRRQLLNGITLDARASSYANKDCVRALVSDGMQELMTKIDERVTIVPIVDDSGKLVDYFQYENRVHVPVAAPNLQGNEFKYLVDAFLSTWISSSGSYINRFESEFSSFCECEYGVAVSNGTVALHLALVALGVKAGDEVIVPDLTFAATINAVLHAGATPVIVDVEEDSWCIAPKEIEKAITDKTKAIIPVHIYGQPCDMDAIMKIAKQYGLFVIEDCAEAHGATFKGKKVGSFGDISTFSFFGNKVITTGEGGMCVTSSNRLDERMRVLRDHGMSKQKRYWHEEVGYNYRMTNLQAAIGVAQLERIEEIIADRSVIENQYAKTLESFGFISFQKDVADRSRIVWLASALVENVDRDDVLQRLKDVKIDARPFFYPLSEMPVYADYVYSSSTSKVLSSKGLSFPTSTKLTDEVKDRVFQVFKAL